MKNNFRLFIGSALILVLAVSLSCKKKLFDYRKKYIGNYTIQYYQKNTTSGIPINDTTITYTGEVKLDGLDKLSIKWYNGKFIPFYVNRSEELSLCDQVVGSVSLEKIMIEMTNETCGTNTSDTTSLFKVTALKIK